VSDLVLSTGLRNGPICMEYRVDFLSDILKHRRVLMPMLASIILVMTTVLIPQTAQAANLRKYAGIVVDAKTGKTLYSYGADSKRYPASVSKVMTLYIVFEELAAGRLKLSSKLKVSKYASSAEPTKLYLKPGSTIAVSDAIQSLVTKSANDVARVIAENISGSVPNFAKRMTKTARALGMSRTTYKNPSGLPNSAQITTVRDQARLGMAVFQHFPQYFKYFKTRSFRYRGNTYGNHNRLLGNVRGVDGIKTGYTRASGHNLLTSARHGNRHIIVAGFGFDSGASRNAKVSALVRKYLPKARKGSYWKQAAIAKPRGGSSVYSAQSIAVALRGTPPARPKHLGGGSVVAAVEKPPVVPEPITVAIKPAPAAPPRAEETIVVAAVQDIPKPPNRPLNLLAGTEPQQLGVIAVNEQGTAPLRQSLEQANGFTPLDLLGNLINRKQPSTRSAPVPLGLIPPGDIDPQTTSSITAAPALNDTPTIWTVQVGAAKNQANANQLLEHANNQLAILKNYRPAVQTVTRNGQSFYRARFVGFTGETEAAMACEALKERNIKCLALPG